MPTAEWIGCHSTCWTSAEETDSGGGTMALPASIIVLIWMNLIPASTRMMPKSTRMAITQRFQRRRGAGRTAGEKSAASLASSSAERMRRGSVAE